MIVNLLYRGLLTDTYYREPIELVNENALDSLKHHFEINFPVVSQCPNGSDIFRFCNGTTWPECDVFKWKLFKFPKEEMEEKLLLYMFGGKVTEIAQLVAIEEVE